MANNNLDTINEINFTKRCILMSVISKEKNMVLINSFHKIPIVKLFTADSTFENFIYTKIKGAFCLFMSKDRDIKNRKYYFRIYCLKNYSLLFNMEIKKEYMQYISQYKDDFYFMQLHQSFLGFKFLTKESGRVFFLLLNEDPKKEILDQNEGAMNIKPKDVSKTVTKVIDYIKMRLKYKFETTSNPVTSTGTNYRKREAQAPKKEYFPILNINDSKGEYFDTSAIPDIEKLFDNIEIDEEEKNGVFLFTNKNLNLEKCQKILKKYENNMDNTMRRRGGQNIPVTIIDKDCWNILNKDIYTKIMTQNVFNNLNAQKRLDIFKQEYKKRHKGKGSIPTGGNRRKSKPRLSKVGKRDSRLSVFSKMGTSERTTLSEPNSDDKGRRLSYNKTPLIKFNSNNNISPNVNNTNNISTNIKLNAKSVDKEYKGKFAKDKMKINDMQSTDLFADMGMEKDDEGDHDKGGFSYFSKNDDKKVVVSNNKQNNVNTYQNAPNVPIAKKGVDIIEERPEDEEKDRERRYKKREIKMPVKYDINNKKNNVQTNNNIQTNNKIQANNIQNNNRIQTNNKVQTNNKIQTNNYTGNNNINANANTNANSIAARANFYKRPIAGKGGKPPNGNFIMGMAKK